MSGTSTSQEQPGSPAEPPASAGSAPAPVPAARPRWRRVLRAVAAVVASLWVVVTLAAFGYDVTTGETLARPPLDADGHDVRTGDLVTHYEQWGTTGPPIVLVHGFLESAWVWHLAGPRLAAQGYQVYAIDVRGFGYTERRGPYTLASDTEQLGAFLTALHLTPADGAIPVLVGHSSGAAIVTDLARLQPASVRRIVLMDGDGTPYGVGPGWIHSLFVDPYATAAIRLLSRHPSLAADAVYGSACGPGCPPFEADAWTRPIRVAGAEAALKDILGQPLIGLTYAEEEQVRVPATVVYGSEDPQMTAGQAAATAQRLRTTGVVPVAGANHLGMLSHPALLAEVLARAAR
jgi:pimeloyl-ACP methyl ester carboxylesterase